MAARNSSCRFSEGRSRMGCFGIGIFDHRQQVAVWVTKPRNLIPARELQDSSLIMGKLGEPLDFDAARRKLINDATNICYREPKHRMRARVRVRNGRDPKI